MNLAIDEHLHLKQLALKVREHCIRMSSAGGTFLGASLSCVDILVYLYSKFLNINPQNSRDQNRDYLFLSKGHGVPALYATLAELNFFDKNRLMNHLQINDFIYWHPNTNIPGIEFHSGSLGHSLSVALGIALDCKIKNTNNKVVVILGDGELNEGSIWEACLVAQANHINNLIIIIDHNGLQANVRTSDLIPLNPLDLKFDAFGWDVNLLNGHSFDEIHKAFCSIPFSSSRPLAIIADTIRGKGLPSIENRVDRWFCKLNNHEAKSLVDELHTHAAIN